MGIVVGISSASGVICGIRLLERLKEIAEVDTHLILSKYGRLNIELETDHTVSYVEGLADVMLKERRQ